ncbi:hypothetical protein [Photobacterium rosenbergii]|uniref:Uncharacterized protein n=1 Tax=Photobacterium rosenbergii TaxID=294936 RepID=A0ABU3ZLS4_9GAMM|nr:hypothetical protein [Photobacterium rosenbergii]MDV5171047.1 hypothetical protein [Photobacterium rosenbergii]
MNRIFFRLNEVKDLVSISYGDFLSLIDYGELTLCAWLEGQKFGLVSKNNALLGVFDYSGTVSLTKRQSKTLLCEGKTIRLEQFLIQEPERIKAIIDCREWFADLPNHTFSKLSYSGDVPNGPFVACGPVGLVADQRASLNYVKNKQQQALVDGEKVDLLDDWMSLLVDAPVKQLGIKPIEIKPEQLRFDIRKLAEQFGPECLKQPERFGFAKQIESQTVMPSNRTSTPIEPNVETNPIKVIMGALLDEYPTARSDKLWNLLRQDFKQTVRCYDIEQVIDEMTQDQIIWFGRGRDAENVMSYKTFQNQLSAVRKQRFKT